MVKYNFTEILTNYETKGRDKFWKNKIPQSSPSPNSLTMFRIAGASLSLVFHLNFPVFALTVIILFLSDYFDGIIARTQDRETKFGKWADPIADKLLMLSVIYYFYLLSPHFWLAFLLPIIVPELLFVALGAALILLKVTLLPRPVIWGRLKFTFYFLAVILFILERNESTKFFLILGICFAYLAIISYLARGLNESKVAITR